MSDESRETEELSGWDLVGSCLNQGDLRGARAALQKICESSPDLAEAWINLAQTERALEELQEAAAHMEKGVQLLSARDSAPDPLLLPAWLSLGEIYEILEDVPKAEKVLRAAYARAPEMASALIQLAALHARSGDLEKARKTAREYCMAAVSILSEKASIGMVRKFQKALDQAASVKGGLLLIATREAAAMAFDRAFEKLGEGWAREPMTSTQVQDLYGLKRADAALTHEDGTVEAKDLLSGPVFGFPGTMAVAKEALFSVPADMGAPFQTLVSSRTSWNDMHIRIRFRNLMGEDAIQAITPVMDSWFRRGFAGEFSSGDGKGFFHSIQRPAPVGQNGVRIDLDMGMSYQKAIDALMDDLKALHATHPIDKVVFGDGLLG